MKQLGKEIRLGHWDVQKVLTPSQGFGEYSVDAMAILTCPLLG